MDGKSTYGECNDLVETAILEIEGPSDQTLQMLRMFARSYNAKSLSGELN